MIRFPDNSPMFRGVVASILAGLLAMALPACSPEAEIVRYEEPPEETAESPPQAAAATSGEAASGGPVPLTYDAPEGWTEDQAGGMRKAAFHVEEGQQKAEITVIDLAASAGSLLPNINRWREQIQLGQITMAELPGAISPIEVAGGTGYYVELVGPEDAQRRQAILAVLALRGGRAWFFKLWGDGDLALKEKVRFQDFVKSVRWGASGGGLPSAPATAEGPPGAATADAASATADSGPSPRLEYDVPEGWTREEAQGMRQAALRVQDGDQAAEITIVALPAAAGKSLAPINLWRQQVGLGEVVEEELEKAASSIQVLGVEGRYLELVGPETSERRLAIVAAVAMCQDKTWFLKMAGDADLTLREKERFQGFIKSVKFAATDGAKHDD